MTAKINLSKLLGRIMGKHGALQMLGFMIQDVGLRA